MPGRVVDNGREGTFTFEYEIGPSGDIQVVAERQLSPVTQPSAANRRFTVGAAAISLPSIPATATRALISVEADAIRWLDDPDAGVHPTSTHGHLLKPPSGDSVYYWIHGRDRILNFEMIQVTTAATVQVSYY